MLKTQHRETPLESFTTDELDACREELHQWGRWAANTGIHRLWYPGRTVEADLREYGQAIKGTGANPEDKRFFEIEQAVNSLSMSYREVILVTFLEARKQGRSIKANERASLCGLSVPGYYNRLNIAVALVAGKIL